MKRKKKAKPRKKEPPLSDAESFDCFERDAQHIVASIGRVKDPMLRYLICAMVDRLTQQIIALASTGDVQRAHALKAMEIN